MVEGGVGEEELGEEVTHHAIRTGVGVRRVPVLAAEVGQGQG